MIHVCPFCGHELETALTDGLTHCAHCQHTIDSSDLNKLLAAGWQIRKHHYSLEQIKHIAKLSDDFAILVQTYVGEYEYSQEEFLKLLKKLGVAHKSYINYN